MLILGLTGGIGAGKSTVSDMLAARGAIVIDTDLVAREVVAPSGAAHEALVARFGPEAAADRARLADIVFEDPDALAALNAIVHPAVRHSVLTQVAELRRAAESPPMVVLDVPLLVETGRQRYDVAAVIVVDCPEELAITRLVESRRMEESDARRRIAAQATRADRLAIADIVITNTGTLDDLAAEVQRIWVELLEAD